MKNFTITNIEQNLDFSTLVTFTLKLENGQEVNFDEYLTHDFDEEILEIVSNDSQTDCGYNDKVLEMLNINDINYKDFCKILEKELNKQYNVSDFF